MSRRPLSAPIVTSSSIAAGPLQHSCPLDCGYSGEIRIVETGGPTGGAQPGASRITAFVCPECLGVAFDGAILSDPRKSVDLTATLRPVVARIRSENSIDPLTQTKNRAFFFRRLVAEIAALRHRSFISIAAFSFDLPKLYRTSGTRAGDIAIQTLASSLLASVRVGDDLARVEPDTFGLILRNADEDAAYGIADRISDTAFRAPHSSPPHPFMPLHVAVVAADGKNPVDAWNEVLRNVRTFQGADAG